MRFRAHFGSNPIAYAKIWEDLLQSIPDIFNKIEDGRHKKMIPKQLFESSKEYSEDYLLKVSREHIY